MRPLSNRIWVHEDSMSLMGTRLSLRMAVVKLSDDSVWIWCPTPHDPGLQKQIEEIGRVEYIVAAANGHNLFVEDWQRACPDATVYLASGIPKRRPKLKGYQLLRDLSETPWSQDLRMIPMDGAPLFDEHIFHHPSSRTLFVTDFFQNDIGTEQVGLGKLVSRLIFQPLGFKGSYMAPPLKMKFVVKDRQVVRTCLDRLWELDIETVVPTHGAIWEEDAKQVIRQLSQRFYD